MNKLLIPAILTATVLIAGIFAFVPVDKANTVHDLIIAAISGTAGITIVSEENVVLPKDGTNVIFTFTADTDSIVHAATIDNTPTCNPTEAGVCLTSDEDFTPTLDGDTDDDPLCTISSSTTFDDSPDDASDDRYTLWECDEVSFQIVFAAHIKSPFLVKRFNRSKNNNNSRNTLAPDIGRNWNSLKKVDGIFKLGSMFFQYSTGATVDCRMPSSGVRKVRYVRTGLSWPVVGSEIFQ